MKCTGINGTTQVEGRPVDLITVGDQDFPVLGAVRTQTSNNSLPRKGACSAETHPGLSSALTLSDGKC